MWHVAYVEVREQSRISFHLLLGGSISCFCGFTDTRTAGCMAVFYLFATSFKMFNLICCHYCHLVYMMQECGHMCATAHVEARGQLWEIGSFLPLWILPGIRLRLLGLCIEHFYLQSLLAISPIFIIILKKMCQTVLTACIILFSI